MKILIAGDFSTEFHEKALSNAFRNLRNEVYEFGWSNYFKGSVGYIHKSKIWDKIKSFRYRLENKFLFGPILNKINSDLIRLVEENRPELIFIYRGTHIYPKTVKRISKSSIVFGYNNDNPFNPKYPKHLFRHFLNSTAYYHHVFAYRQVDIESYKNVGILHTSMLRSFYIESRNFPINNQKKQYKYDVVFIGHYEDDGRDEIIKEIIEAGFQLQLFGPHWEYSKNYSYFISKLETIPMANSDYNQILNDSKIALVFFSKLNLDTYTRRVFEIPASKTFMLSEYTVDMSSLFIEGKEAEYFRNSKELIIKIEHYLKNEKERIRIAENGYKKVRKDGHEAVDRAKQILSVFENVKGQAK